MKYNPKNSFILFSIITVSIVNAEWDSSLLGRLAGFASATYDSRVFGIPSNYYNQLKVMGATPALVFQLMNLKAKMILYFPLFI